MERGVVVGGLMICASFLLAASLNRSAVDETPPGESAPAVAPMAMPLPALNIVEPKADPCAADATESEQPGDEPEQGDLPGNGRDACSR